ncbi:4-methylaminobutanoate oxidase (formaldehyde-forming) [compost metagenome]
MKDKTQVVVIGGGVIGCSVLYHLTKFGWRDVMLLERKVLTAGSTWHAAAGFHTLNGDMNMARLQSYTIELYKEIEEVGDQNVGIHVPGGISIAATPERWEFLKTEYTRHKFMGIESELITPSEIAAACPLVDTRDVLGGLWFRDEGHLDPYGCTHAYARAARKNGAEIHQQTKVDALKQRPDGTWDVYTDKGVIHAEHVVNAAGLWAREVGAMAGVKLPLIPMEHHYLITEEIPELKAFGKEIPVIADLDGEIYMRQEHNGVLLGVYEKNCLPWALEGTPWSYGESDLLPPNLERLEDALLKGFERFPLVGEAGIKKVVNGPFTFTPDGNPVIGPVRGVRNYWVAAGCMAGFSQGGGIGLALAQWMIEGEPQDNVFAMDVARYPHLTQNYVTAKAKEFYGNRFYLAKPNEQWPAGRPLKTTPIYEEQKKANAIFGVGYGLEMPMWFAPEGVEPVEIPTFRRSNAFEHVAKECQIVRENVGLFDAASFAKYEISGPGAAAWLDRVFANRLPEVGRARLAPLLLPSGRLKGDLTMLRLAEDRFMVTGSGYLQEWHMRWFEEHMPSSGVRFQNNTETVMALTLSGPKAPALLIEAFGPDVLAGMDKILSVRDVDLGFAPGRIARIGLSGELGFELYVESQYLPTVYKCLLEAGKAHGLTQIGVWALMSLRLEKSYGIWNREYATDYTPAMSGLDHFVDFSKPDFIGRDAVLRARETPPSRRLVTLVVDALDVDASGFEPIWIGDQLVGYTTSGGYGHTVGKSIAMGYVDTDRIDVSGQYHVDVLGERRAARVVLEPLYDPTGARMRAPIR